ncbi:uncharacterized protein Z520_03284 [Fonsecaea multimorphosa CBS 102226]|uniref:Monopolin complex subunit Csm1/Pcs1 C-terminal domain-containing protein n=1 Tax=Fonsecaea multimorphosa CBS 102226 TaxID=1442371 RepID=A0A0D2HFB0_9EURO|nr:uncharacterized protein Z520_03284 [Fonsecaea multimorphosa CBS 102226]KIY00621.1 hypothetical protein Z520_03284 [Fonsecaea multimorphosa CBS 102226]OAL19011.1 hypothetical protein AYO22_10340 [Fonsecaea multimorphosa]
MKGIADLIDSDMEEAVPFIDENSILSSASDATNATTTKTAPAKRGKKRQRVTMPPRAKSKAQKNATAEVKKVTSRQIAGVKRKAVADDANEQDSDVNLDDTSRDSEPDKQPIAPKTKRGKRTNTRTKAAPEAAETVDNEDQTMEASPQAVRSKYAAARTKKEAPKVFAKANAPTKSKVTSLPQSPVLERQHEEIEAASEELEVVAAPKGRAIARDASRTRQEPPYRRRAGSASDTERSDPNLRRKLGDITRKFENVDLKYRNLREVGINEANANMEKLQRQCDATMQASNDLIASLKNELATQVPLAHEARKLRRQMQNQEAEMERMRDTALQLSASLADAQNEIKGLQAKLVAARASSVDNPKPPSSAMKSTVQRHLTGEAAQAAQVAQMKEELYSDLTGLVILNVKKTAEGDLFNCIQTGRNGTLHFSLFIDQEIAKGASFEETEYLYTPLLDRDRDHEMMKLMPSYLTEDITFARHNAAKFYGRVVDTITKKRGDE